MKKLLACLIIVSLFVGGCSFGKSEKERFIDATVEATCMVFEAENIFDPALEEKAKEIYEKYGFDATDDEAMEALTLKYQDDEEFNAAIEKALEECAGDFLEAFEDIDMELSEEDLLLEEDMVMEEEAVEEPVE